MRSLRKRVFRCLDSPSEKVAGFGSDGAAVMTGVCNVVGVQLKQVYPLLVHVHCMAHRLALVVSQAAGEIPQLKAYQLYINNIYHHYQYSAVRYNKLREIQQVVEETPVALKQPHSVHRCRYNKLREIQQVVDETPVALKQPHSVHWLSLDPASG